jgi:hypothetical protein
MPLCKVSPKKGAQMKQEDITALLVSIGEAIVLVLVSFGFAKLQEHMKEGTK